MSSQNSSKVANRDVSPKRKNSRGKLVSRRQREIIVNIYKDIKVESPEMKYKTMIAEICEITGIGSATVTSTISEYKKTGTVSSPNKKRSRKSLFDRIDDLDRKRLRQKVHSFWLRRELPTVDKILTAVNEDPTLPNFKRTTLFNIIKQLDFVFTERKKCISLLTEKEDLICWRRSYLYNIRKYRDDGRTVYYLGETCLNTDLRVDHLWMDKTVTIKQEAIDQVLTAVPKNPTGKGKSLIVLHIGSDQGFLPGGLLCLESMKNNPDYLDEMNGDNFQEWFESILPRLEQNSIIVMDNAPHHSVKTEQIPTANSKKDEILEWLISKGITPERPMLRAELLRMVKQIESKYTSYIIDNIAEEAGHKVLRLPPYHFEFNPIELAWVTVKEYVKKHNTTNIDDVCQLLSTAIERVTCDNWQHFIEHVIKEEDKIWKVDEIIDEIVDQLEPFVHTVTGCTSSNDD